MKVSIIIATVNRVTLLPELLRHLEHQTRPPEEVLLSAPDESHVVQYVPKNYALRFVFGPKGACIQRNRAIDEAIKSADIITFFDDDFLPANNYIENVVAAFNNHPEWAVLMGNLAADGARGPGLSFAAGLSILRNAERARTASNGEHISKHVGAYGCNMSVRAAQVGALRFDERLVLHGWQEDIDFTSQLRRFGDIIGTNMLLGVHLGAKSGRVNGIRLGYSQVCNPVYLMKKGTMPPIFALELMSRNLTANFFRSFWSETYISRRGRLLGNFLALYHLLQGKVEPEYILNL